MRRTIATVAVLALVAAFALPQIAAAKKGGWVLLGERHVTDKLDHDTIVVTVADGRFHKLQLRVHDHAVQFHKVVVHFGDNSSQELALREVVRANGHTRPIDLAGGDRVIRSIDLWYDAQSVKGKGATVRVFGMR
jgi:hypothetical protein